MEATVRGWAGKTTGMRCIFDLVHPDAGEVLWGGAPVGPAERLRFGYDIKMIIQ